MKLSSCFEKAEHLFLSSVARSIEDVIVVFELKKTNGKLSSNEVISLPINSIHNDLLSLSFWSSQISSII